MQMNRVWTVLGSASFFVLLGQVFLTLAPEYYRPFCGLLP